MIIRLILNAIFELIVFVVSLLPDYVDAMKVTNYSLTVLLEYISKAFIVFPSDIFFIAVSNIIFWKAVQLTFAVIEFCYKKIPGIN